MPSAQDDCIFCRIAAGTAPARIVAEDDRFIAIVPIEEEVAGHTLVLPRAHAENVLDIDSATLAALSVFAQGVARRLIGDVQATGVNVLHAAGRDAQQSVFHFHLHLIPRRPSDGLNCWVTRP